MKRAQKLDYDRVAATYDRRFAEEGPSGITAALLGLAGQFDHPRMLEVGCGTGFWLDALRLVAGLRVGLDFSAGMLAQAQQRPRPAELTRGTAGRLPYPTAYFDLAYCVNAIHHFDQPIAFIEEAWRVLRPGGRLSIIGSDPTERRDLWYVYDYFPGTYETDLERFAAHSTVQSWLAQAGFQQIERRLAERIVAHKSGREILGDPFLEKNSCSQLALLSEAEYAAGVQRIRQALGAADAAGEALHFPVLIEMYQISGIKA